jgi:outer membrane protein
MNRYSPLLLALLCVAAVPASAQQRIGYVDSEIILRAVPEYQTVRAQLDQQIGEWEAELERMQIAINELEREFEARSLLFTDEERERRLRSIQDARTEMGSFRRRHFGPEGELFRQQQQALRPIQERIIEAIETVAEAGNFDYVFDRSGEYLFLFARQQHNLTERVLDAMGIDPTRVGTSAP